MKILRTACAVAAAALVTAACDDRQERVEETAAPGMERDAAAPASGPTDVDVDTIQPGQTQPGQTQPGQTQPGMGTQPQTLPPVTPEGQQPPPERTPRTQEEIEQGSQPVPPRLPEGGAAPPGGEPVMGGGRG
jgi:hypothetical protein